MQSPPLTHSCASSATVKLESEVEFDRSDKMRRDEW